MTRIVLNEGLVLELFNFVRLLKMRPMVSDEHKWRNSWQTNCSSGRRNTRGTEEGLR